MTGAVLLIIVTSGPSLVTFDTIPLLVSDTENFAWNVLVPTGTVIV